MTFAHDAWLSGFIDGEGCFTRVVPGKPKFSIGLNADDRQVLVDLQAEFGGRLYESGPRGATRAAVRWFITTRPELEGLVRYLERFPLRAKKAEQFATWREEYGL